MLEIARRKRRSLVQDLRNGHLWDRRVSNTGDMWEMDLRKSALGAPSKVPASDLENKELRDAIDAALGGPDPKRAYDVDKLLKAGASAAELWPNLRVVLVSDDTSELTYFPTHVEELLG